MAPPPDDEPPPVAAPPAPRLNLVAVRDRRDEIIAILSEQFASDVFEVDELERRLDLAHQARSIAELDALVADLGLATTPTTALAPRPAAEIAPAGWPARKRYLAIFSGVQREGRWTVPSQLRLVTVFGGAQLDFRDADFAPGVTELHITCVMGGAHLIVPPWLSVDCDASAIMGGFEEMNRGRGTPDPGRPMLRITGLAVMGGVSIETRLPGESARQARRRSRRERRLLRRAERRGLPTAEVRKLPPGRDA
ncbi:MAG: DUF1707 and DUF2154 domain-containing protein [Kofleriaceae bacterium]|nr:DUF1707 and DUF2154 domain-containing protein [Myxococcales bacterium]MCB9559858.1 DUF1707 and DUF2154 domain-containing protein [Kofleriaceae bacterium]MCB9571470.1 DUF1707 and DUF2154 domain-containing protein [Kofleriaceae bacterium]